MTLSTCAHIVMIWCYIEACGSYYLSVLNTGLCSPMSIPSVPYVSAQQASNFTAYYIDVGQGDSEHSSSTAIIF